MILTADLVIFGQSSTGLKLLAVKTNKPAFDEYYALPGGKFDEADTGLEATIMREVQEETGLVLDSGFLELLGVFDDPGRDRRGRYISVCYLYTCVLHESEMQKIQAGSDSTEVSWIPLNTRLAFDHNYMVQSARIKMINESTPKRVCMGCKQGWCFNCTPDEKIS